jgi:hypothetical protein
MGMCSVQYKSSLVHSWGTNSRRHGEESLRHSTAHKEAANRNNVYVQLRGVTDKEKSRILFGELIWLWRNEAGLGQVEAAAKARITSREWMRIEAGKTLPRADFDE